MSVYAGRAKLKDAAKVLQTRWNNTRSMWRDNVAMEFEDKHIQPMISSLRKAQEAMERMDMIIARVRRDCE